MRQRTFCAIMIALSILIGGTVNPVRSGMEALEHNTLGQAVQSYAEQDTGKWLAVSDQWVLGNFLIMYGAPTLNCTNTYMNTALWEALDPTGKFEEAYNRYAHITFELTNSGQTDVILLTPDLVHVVVPVEALLKTGVEYLVSEKDLSVFDNGQIHIRQVFSSPDVMYAIYHLEPA